MRKSHTKTERKTEWKNGIKNGKHQTFEYQPLHAPYSVFSVFSVCFRQPTHITHPHPPILQTGNENIHPFLLNGKHGKNGKVIDRQGLRVFRSVFRFMDKTEKGSFQNGKGQLSLFPSLSQFLSLREVWSFLWACELCVVLGRLAPDAGSRVLCDCG